MTNQNIQEMFVAAAAQFADNTAIERGGERLTYRELDQRSNALANYLISAGTAKGAIVAILAKDAVTVMTSIIGILKAGAVFVPLDPQIPEKRLEAMLSVISPEWFIVELELSSKAHDIGAGSHKTICFDQELWTINGDEASFNPMPPLNRSEPDDLCYIYFTSGSTGVPKAIAGRLKGIDHFIRWEIETLGINSHDRVSQLLPFSFDGSLRDIFVPLCSGATACVLENRETIQHGAKLVEWLDQQLISVVHCIPSVFRLLLNEGLTSERFTSLRYVLMTGEPLLPGDVARWMDVFGDRVKLINLYGTSETTMAKFSYFVQPADQHRHSIPIGKPIKGAKALLVDEDGKPCARGMVGEIYIRTAFRAHGYYNQPELTREVFIQNPFSDDPTDIVYRTGDLARVLEDGNFEYLGRKDQQVKIRGVRVELKEIENLLHGHHEIDDVVVVDRQDAGGSNYLCAYLVLNNGTGPQELRTFLASRLPDYMVPSSFVIMDELPRTISGKIDRRALPLPGDHRAGLNAEYVAPRNSVEELLVNIWIQLLGVEQIGVHDNFFQLGGHSLNATQVISRVRRAFEVEIPLSSLLETPTVAALARHVETAMRAGQALAVPPIVHTAREAETPLSHAQQRLWFLHQLDPTSPAYNMPLALRLTGQLDTVALERAINEIVRRHESLRTTFRMSEGRLVQIPVSARTLTLETIDLKDVPAAEREAAIRRLAAEEAGRPFELTSDELLRFSLLRVAEDEHVALLTMHHIISDGWSMGVLVQELAPLYEAFSTGGSSPLPELPIQYADYAVWQRQLFDSEFLETQLAYWREHLGGEPQVLNLPTDRPRPPVQTFTGRRQSLLLTPELTKSINSLSQKEGVTLFMTLLAVFDILLSRYSGQEEIVVGTDVANRNQLETEGLIGLFVNQLVLRTDLSGQPTFRELLARVRRVTLDAYVHQDLPLDKLVEALNPERDLSRSPLFQVMLVLQNAPVQRLSLSGLTMQVLSSEPQTSKFDLSLYVTENDAGLLCDLEYNTDLFDSATIAQMLDSFHRLLAEAVVHPDTAIRDLPILGEVERKQLLVEFNNTRTDYHAEQKLHQLFEEQVERTPNVIALKFADQSLTYAELNRRANQLAHRLRAVGVGPDALVGVCMERSVEMVVSLIAILKANGAYMPLDPQYPQERLAFMIRTAAPIVVLTQEYLSGLLSASDAPVICLDRDWPLISDDPVSNINSDVAADNLAYVIYTSGSTGQPKGVMNTHGAIRNRLLWMQHQYRLTGGDRVLQKTPFSFDVSVWEFFWPLISGARLVLARPGGQLDSDYLVELINNEQITTLHFVPSMLEVFLDHEGVGKCTSLRQVMSSGEALSVQLQRRFYSRITTAQLHNLYGPTEAAVDVSYWSCERETAADVVPIGRPIANTQLYILDRQMQPMPIGVPGELFIGGAGLARGYLERPDLTAERFIPDPFSREPGARLYRTGDVARFRAGGEIEYLGRDDHQVKIRGNRIELGEIKALLEQHEQVKEAVVLVREERSGDKRLVGYVVGRDGAEVEAGQLRSYLRKHLPEYMVPGVIVSLKEMPLTPNGKMDRRALPAPDFSQRELECVTPRTEVERQISAIWREALGIDHFGVHDNFFDLGGHSLLMAQVHNKLQETLSIEITIVEMFQYPTISSLAKHLSFNESEQHSSEQSQLRVTTRKESARRQRQSRMKNLQQTKIA
jgi:amino acid adenylation domain-containing protein